MNHTSENINWAISAKGNHWRRIDGIVLVVGQFNTSDDYWAMRDGKFLSGHFNSIGNAQYAAEHNLGSDDNGNSSAYEWGW